MKNNKLENIKKWTISTYKCSRQTLYEKLGKTSKTVDPELDDQIETLRDTQRKYSNILRLAKALCSHFYNMVQTQVSLATSRYPHIFTAQSRAIQFVLWCLFCV